MVSVISKFQTRILDLPVISKPHIGICLLSVISTLQTGIFECPVISKLRKGISVISKLQKKKKKRISSHFCHLKASKMNVLTFSYF